MPQGIVKNSQGIANLIRLKSPHFQVVTFASLAALSGTASAPAVNGVARFTDLSINTAQPAYRLLYSAGLSPKTFIFAPALSLRAL
jgi:hypothetical protein